MAKRARRFLTWLAVPLCCVALAGCKSLGHGAAKDGEEEAGDAGFSSNIRNPTPKGELSGLDPRAREIERHLGVR